MMEGQPKPHYKKLLAWAADALFASHSLRNFARLPMSRIGERRAAPLSVLIKCIQPVVSSDSRPRISVYRGRILCKDRVSA